MDLNLDFWLFLYEDELLWAGNQIVWFDDPEVLDWNSMLMMGGEL